MAVETIGADTANSRGTSITPSASAHTKGSWTQLVASSGVAARGILVLISGGAASSVEDYLVDIGTGGAGSETVVVANLPEAGPTNRLLKPYFCPVAIPAGTRISARCQCGAASAGAIFVMAYVLPAPSVGLDDCTTLTTYGADPSTTRGLSIDPGGSANTKGSWVELSASTSDPIDWILPCIENLGDTVQSICEWLVDLGTGGAGSETVVVANLQFQSNSITNLKIPAYPPIPVDRIAAGTRLAVRAQCNITTAGDRLLGFILVTAQGTASGGSGLTWAPLSILAGAGLSWARTVASGGGLGRG